MISKLLKRSLLLLGAMVIFVSTMNSQTLQDMTVAFSDGSYTPATLQYAWGPADDNVYSIGLPFAFTFDGTSSSTIYLSANGIVSFYPYNNYYYYYSSGLNQIWPSVQVIRNDLYVYGNFGIGVSGVAPNRVIECQWTNVDYYYYWGASMNFQVKLYETTNKIDIIFGSFNYANATGYYGPYLGFVGSANSSYINIEPGSSSWTAHFSSKNPAPNYANTYLNTTTLGYISSGKTISLTAFPSLAGVYPSDGAILRRGQVYTGAQHPAMAFNRLSGQQNVYANYKIAGPLPGSNPDYKVIYTGTNANPADELIFFNPQPLGSPGWANIPYAKGIAAGANGDLDLATNESDIPGGEYTVESQMLLPSFNYYQEWPVQTIVIALDDDIAITALNSPASKTVRKYPQTSSIDINCKVSNIGINPVYEYGVRANMYKDGSLVYTDSVHWASATPMTTGQYHDVAFARFRPREVGDYKVVFYVTLLSGIDDEMSNNIMPRSSQPNFFFEVAYELEGEVAGILVPGDTVYVKRPILPAARYKNNGVSVISEWPSTIYIVKMVAPFDTVYRDNIIIEDIPEGRVNIADYFFTKNFIPPSAGTYKACVTISSNDDAIASNNIFCKTFTVIDAMAGTYTIGTTYGGSRNFATITDALNALYLKGLTGPVTFEFTDANYNVGDVNMLFPAIDLSANIIGAGATNTITFKASSNRSVNKGSVTLNLYSGVGIGMLFGQNSAPTNNNAAVYSVVTSLKKTYAKSEGYIIIDGGSQKALKFRLHSNSQFRAGAYLAEGSNNITIKNCIFEDAAPNKSAFSIPLTRYNNQLQKFEYEPNTRTGNVSYSSGILMRAILPFDKNSTDANTYKLDTGIVRNAIIQNNEISGFGYGITDIGVGPVKDGIANVFKHYYNKNNSINANTIFNVGRAGIFIGFEEDSKIQHNKIFNVGDRTFNEAAGILAGGEGTAAYDGYNNINVEIIGNEASNITSNMLSYGIRVEQYRLDYPYTNPPTYVFPDEPENMLVMNNSIWGLFTESTAGSRVGIHLYTTRTQANVDFLTKMITPLYTDYWSRNDKIVNNTIFINWDNGMMTSGMLAGIAIQSVIGAQVYNNAIALLDQDVILDNPMYAGIFYQGQFPKPSIFKSDRNAFWAPPNSSASVYRFIETDDKSNIIDFYSRDEYKNLVQWYQWTKQDMNSVFGNFTTDFVYLGGEPNQKLRIQTVPQPPMSSILNNRGERLAYNTTDIDGNPRGSSGLRFDIGDQEFTGRMAITDVEALMVTDPGAFKINAGPFSEAEYVMTQAPIEVKALVRNNGNIQQFGVMCTVKVYLELPNGNFSTAPELTKIAVIDIPSSETAQVSFNLADYLGLNFYPRTFGDLRGLGYVLPDNFVTMEANVTPRYKIEVAVQADQNNTNNIVSKVVRFYLMRANTRMVLSAENSFVKLDNFSSTDQVAGRVNYDSVTKAFKRFGWKIDIDADPPVYDYDVFDRLGWEPKAVNYNTFRSVVWSDGDDKVLNRFQTSDIKRFLDMGTTIEKKNLMIGSQEMVRELSKNGLAQNLPFVNGTLRATTVNPENPMGLDGDNTGNVLIGMALERYLTEGIVSTGVLNDVPPYCGLMKVNPAGEGMAQPAYYYSTKAAGVMDSVAGVATTSLTKNVVHVGVDWRHWGNINMVLRAYVDFIEKNGGTVIPVELLDFNAVAAGNRVDINWTTASELNSDKFEVERSVISEIGTTEFAKIAEEKAAGKSEVVKHYGPVVDKNVAAGGKYAYRLKMLDLDGKYEYSKSVEVALDGSGNWLDNPTPNPANIDANVSWSLAADGMVTLNLYDITGKSVLSIYNAYATAGNHVSNLNVSSLPAGTYSIILTSGTQSFIKQIQVIK